MNIAVDAKRLRGARESLSKTEASLKKAHSLLKKAENDLRGTGTESYVLVSSSLSKTAESVEKYRLSVRSLKKGIADVAAEYVSSEHSIVSSKPIFANPVWKTITAALGPVGNVITAGAAAVSGDYAKTGLEIGKGIKTIVKNTDGGKVAWKEAFGLDKIIDAVGPVKKTGKKIISKADWAFQLVESAIDNYKEHGRLSSRFFEETGVETVINVAEGALVYAVTGAAIGAAVAALGVSAPAWAVGAAAVGVGLALDWGINALVRRVTGNPKADWKESVSDFVCDTGEKAFKSIKKSLNIFTKGIKKSKSKIKWAPVLA